MTVTAIKLISGEEIIGENNKETETHITLKNMVSVVMQRTPEGEIAIGFIQFASYLGKDKEVSFDKKTLIFIEEVDDQLRNRYNQTFSGVVVPEKKLILG